MNKQIALVTAFTVMAIMACTIIATDISSAEEQADVGTPGMTDTMNPASIEDLKNAITTATDNSVITLGGSFEITEQIDVNKTLTIDLNNNTLVIKTDNPSGFFFTATSTIRNGYINDFRDGETIQDADGNDVSDNGWRVIVASGSGVTLKISNVEIYQENPVASSKDVTRYNYSIIGNDGASIELLEGTRISSSEFLPDNSDGVVGVAMVGKNGGDHISELVVGQGVTIMTTAFAISGDGTDGYGDVDFDIDGGMIISLASHAIYQPQVGDMTVDGDATIDGVTGIEIRAGTLTINSGSITGTGSETICIPNNDEATTSGAGIAVVQHTTGKTITVTINNGAITGNTALYEDNAQNNPESSTIGITLAISGGSFLTNGQTPASLDIKDYDKISLDITGGQYSKRFPDKYLESDYYLLENSLGIYHVYSSDEVVTVTFDLDMNPNPTQTFPRGEMFDESALPLPAPPEGTSYIWFDENRYPYNSGSTIIKSVTIRPALVSDTMIDVDIGITVHDGKTYLTADLKEFSDSIPYYTFWGQEYDVEPNRGTTEYHITESGTYLFTTMVLGSDGIYHMGFNSYNATVQATAPSAGETIQSDGDLMIVPTDSDDVDLSINFNNVQSTTGENTSKVQVAIAGTVASTGNVAVSVKPVTSVPEQMVTEQMAAVDVTVSNVATGYQMTIALDVSDLVSEGQFLSGATVYYWEDEDSAPIVIEPSDYRIEGNIVYITTDHNTCYGATVQTTTEDPDQDMNPPTPSWDDEEDYVPPIVPSQNNGSSYNDTTTIVACAAAAVVAALMAAFLIIDRRQ